MATAVDHYAALLAPIYSWMVGDRDTALARSAAELDALNIGGKQDGKAVDLGAGIGLHAMPLAQRGYTVTAIDSNPQLLMELQHSAHLLPVTPVVADLLAFPQYVQRPADVILCMGDTLTHLPDVASVVALLASIARGLNTGGVFVASFRDYATASLTGERRFIPVRSDATRILTCFLEYMEDKVMVHDLLHEWQNGRWQQRVSSYPKLRLAPDWVAQQLKKLGLAVRNGSLAGGMSCVVATRS